MDNSSGFLLAEALKTLNTEISNVVSDDGSVTKEEMGILLTKVVTDFNKSMSQTSVISQGSLDLALLALANYSLLERKVLEGSGKKLDNTVRNTVLDRSFHIMKTGEIPKQD